MFFTGEHVAGRFLFMAFTLVASAFAGLAFYFTWPNPPLLAQIFLALAVVLLIVTIFLPNAALRAVVRIFGAIMSMIFGSSIQ